ncbi:MAG: WbqC family protein [Saprospiraceae bacterium]|nr:WbqC family protein [Saprospiraceae bacterium]
MNRVDIKTPDGTKWLTIPLKNFIEMKNNNIICHEEGNWRKSFKPIRN